MKRFSLFSRAAPLRAAFAVIAALAGWAAAAQTPVSKEYQIKAAFIYNFTKFIEWPAGCFDEATPIVVVVLGKNPFGDELEKIVRGRTVNGHPLVVRYISDLDGSQPAPGRFHVLFVAPGREGRLKLAAGSGILTIGESDAFAAAGGIITFTVAEDRAHFEINLQAAEASGLKLSAQLLKLASAVRR